MFVALEYLLGNLFLQLGQPVQLGTSSHAQLPHIQNHTLFSANTSSGGFITSTRSYLTLISSNNLLVQIFAGKEILCPRKLHRVKAYFWKVVKYQEQLAYSIYWLHLVGNHQL